MSTKSVLKEKPDTLPSNKGQMYKDCKECGKSMKSKSMARHTRDVHNGKVKKEEENGNLPDQPRAFDESINSL